MHRTRLVVPAAALLTVSLVIFACEDKNKPITSNPPKGPPATTTKHDGHAHAPGDMHDHDHDHAHGHGEIQLGSTTSGPFSVQATRDQGQIVAGKDAPVDIIVDPASGQTAKAAAVRFWIGAQDARGSVKAKAEIENPKEPNHWHAHAEIPNPLPTGSKLWVEIEDDRGGKHTSSFDLKM